LTTSIGGGTSSAFATLFSWLRIFILQFEAIQLECLSDRDNAFSLEYTLFTLVFTALILICLLRKANSNNLAGMKQALFAFVILAYTPATYLAFSVCYCIPSNDEDGDISVMWADPRVRCFGQKHSPVFVMGVLVILFHSVGFPVWAHLKLRRLHRFPDSSRKAEIIHYKRCFGDDYLPKYHWIFHCQTLLTFILCSTRVYLSEFSDKTQVLKLILNLVATGILTSMLCGLQPHKCHTKWKFPGQFLVLLLVALCILLEFINYLHLEHDVISSVFVEACSNLVFGLVCFVLFILGGSFYFLIFHTKHKRYFSGNFLFPQIVRLNSKGLSAGASSAKKSSLPSHANRNFASRNGIVVHEGNICRDASASVGDNLDRKFHSLEREPPLHPEKNTDLPKSKASPVRITENAGNQIDLQSYDEQFDIVKV